MKSTRVFAALLTLLMMLSLTACGSKSDGTNGTQTTTSTPNTAPVSSIAATQKETHNDAPDAVGPLTEQDIVGSYTNYKGIDITLLADGTLEYDGEIGSWELDVRGTAPECVNWLILRYPDNYDQNIDKVWNYYYTGQYWISQSAGTKIPDIPPAGYFDLTIGDNQVYRSDGTFEITSTFFGETEIYTGTYERDGDFIYLTYTDHPDYNTVYLICRGVGSASSMEMTSDFFDKIS